MPDLPPLRHKREQEVTPKILKWFREEYSGSCAIEIKVSKGDSVPKSALKDHQWVALMNATTSSGIVHKLSDGSRTRQPFDAFRLTKVKAYVVCVFLASRTAVAIEAKDWCGATSKTPGAFSIPL